MKKESQSKRYRITESPFFSAGSIVEVHRYRDHSSSLFRLVSGKCYYNNASGQPGAWDSFNNMERMEESSMTERVTLGPGDYVSTEGMDEATYHAVARAFIDAGCKGFPSELCKDAKVVGWSSLFKRYGWDWQAGFSFHRELTPEQIINATNAGRTTTDLVSAVRTAKTTLDDARAEYTKALDALREALGEGFVISEVGDAPDDDMTDPANWREGDVFEVLRDGAQCAAVDKGELLTLKDPESDIFTSQETGNSWCFDSWSVRFHHRPNT